MGEPGKMSRTQQLGYQQGPSPDVAGPAGVPGKSTLVGKQPPAKAASAIGDPYIEGKGHCATGTEGGCFLTPDQRTKLVNAYQQEVIVAQQQYSLALTEVQFDRIIKKDDELPMLFGLMLDVLGGQLLSGLTSAVKMLKAGDEKTIAAGLDWLLALQSDAPTSTPDVSVRSFIQGVDEASVSFILKAGIDETKKTLKKPGPSNEKAETLNYIDRLKETAAIAWERQRQDPPGYATDADLIVLFHSFKAKMGHTTPRYKAALKDKIDRFLQSSVSRIGRAPAHKGRDANVATPPSWGSGSSMRDTKVVWVVTAGNAMPQLYYYKLDAAPNQNDHTMGNLEIPMLEPADDRFKISAPVEPEFVETALAKHQETWGTSVETKIVAPTRDVNDLRQYVPAITPPKPAAAKPQQDPVAPIAALTLQQDPVAPISAMTPQQDPVGPINIPSALVPK